MGLDDVLQFPTPDKEALIASLREQVIELEERIKKMSIAIDEERKGIEENKETMQESRATLPEMDEYKEYTAFDPGLIQAENELAAVKAELSNKKAELEKLQGKE